VLDARDPLGCRCTPLEEAVLQRMQGKRIIILLNKIDLVPRENAQRWLAYLRQYFPTLPFKASTQSQRQGLATSGGAGGAECYGAEQLLQLLKNYSRSLNLKTAITVRAAASRACAVCGPTAGAQVGIVGYPNVGKSSVINSLKRARAVGVGATPGLTTTAQAPPRTVPFPGR